MAGKVKDMSKVKQMLRLHQNGVSNRQIATELSINKETVNRYIQRAKRDQLTIGELLKLDDPILQHRMTGGNPAYVDNRFEELKEKLPYYEKELERKHVTLKTLWEEYIIDNPGGYKPPTEDVLTCPIVLALFRPSQIHIRLQVHRLGG